MKKISLILTFLLSGLLYADNSPVGVWTTIDDETKKPKSEIKIEERGGKLYGTIIKLLNIEPDATKNAEGKVICTGCKDPNEKDKPIEGLTIMRGLSQDGDEWSGGTIMDPKDGKVYKCKIEVIEDGKKLKVRGYIGVSFAGRNQFWVRK